MVQKRLEICIHLFTLKFVPIPLETNNFDKNVLFEVTRYFFVGFKKYNCAVILEGKLLCFHIPAANIFLSVTLFSTRPYCCRRFSWFQPTISSMCHLIYCVYWNNNGCCKKNNFFSSWWSSFFHKSQRSFFSFPRSKLVKKL